MRCTVYPAVPARLSPLLAQGCEAQQQGDVITLANDYLTAEISTKEGVIRAVTNKITGREFPLIGDQTGFVAKLGENGPLRWMAGPGDSHSFAVELDNKTEASEVVLTEKIGDSVVMITYRLQRDQFWLERHVKVASSRDPLTFDRLVYGKLEVAGAKAPVLELGQFDRPRLVSLDDGGLFVGVGFWFYSVDEDGLYQNADMAYVAGERLTSEPWYLGVFGTEAGEPFSGWLWYKNFLRMRKMAYDKHACWSYWNAGWGQWGLTIDDPASSAYIDLAHRIGVRTMLFGGGGSGLGVPEYVRLARESEVAKENLAKLKAYGISFGCLESGHLKGQWADPDVLDGKLKLLDEYVGEGLSAYHFDFFSSIDTFTAHRHAAEYFRAAHDKLAYTECHLGMARYGPQFQREVLINHPTDLHGFDISRFSTDWATFLGFRHSRAEWQERYQYLMPEYGLYYFLTHYSNWGHPRKYTDPEPQQFLYRPHAYCGIAYNFHDTVGFREVMAAASAFSPYYVFGHLDLKMPPRDAAYARDYLQWVEDNATVLSLGRVCVEDKDTCVVSKLRDGKGAIYVLNYSPGRRTFKLKLETGSAGPLRIRTVYPARKATYTAQDGEVIEVKVRGESLVILDVNQGFATLPPENVSTFPIDVEHWEKHDGKWKAVLTIPDVRSTLARNRDASLPKKLLSLDQLQLSDPSFVDQVIVRPGEKPRPMITWMGRGKLAPSFLRAYRFRDDKLVAAWKIVPWAFADRVWLVYRPAEPPKLGDGDNLPTLEVNDQTVPMFPRVDYRTGKAPEWTCPMFFADVTEVCQYGGPNLVALSNLNEEKPANCYLISAAD